MVGKTAWEDLGVDSVLSEGRGPSGHLELSGALLLLMEDLAPPLAPSPGGFLCGLLAINLSGLAYSVVISGL